MPSAPAAHPGLYNAVVNNRHRKRWHDFLRAHPGAVTLHAVPPVWRVSLASSRDWEAVDAAHAEAECMAWKDVCDLLAHRLGTAPGS